MILTRHFVFVHVPKTGGNFVLDLKYGEVLSGPKENLAGVQAGAFEMASNAVLVDIEN